MKATGKCESLTNPDGKEWLERQSLAGRDWRRETLDGDGSGHICCDEGDGA